LIHKLNKRLLEASVLEEELLFTGMIDAVLETTNCRMCSLWSINTNNTNGEEFQSASLLVRKLEEGVKYPTDHAEDFVHKLGDCFIDGVLTTTGQTGKPYYACSIEECGKHKSYESLKQMGLHYFVSIPVPDGKGRIIALLKLSFAQKIAIDQLELFAETIRDSFASCFSRIMLYKKQQLIHNLIENYKWKGRKKITDIFYPIIHRIFKQYFDYEGASVFLWNTYDNRYNLLTTTGIQDDPDKKDVFYEEGEGLTGKVAIKGKEKKAKIYDDLIELEKRKDPEYMHKWREVTENEGKTMLVVPILRPSNPDIVLGILRFTNKINEQSKNGIRRVDYFNDADVELIDHASHYLALNIDYFFGEEERSDFISKMSHESKTPANAIRVSANRVIRKMGDPYFIRGEFNHYMQSIYDYAELQIMQASTNLYISRFHRNSSKAERYRKVKRLSIIDVLNSSINIIRPYARDREGILFENITIQKNFPRWYLYIDATAFKTIFYNLLTNAIKYVSDDRPFRVDISGMASEDSLIINIADYGFGVEEKEKENIFLLGVRSEEAKKTSNEGYGIGLHVVRQILDDFGGKIRVAQNRNPTVFEIRLPKRLFNNDYTKTEEWNR
jgi:signal transduction histidine kinase